MILDLVHHLNSSHRHLDLHHPCCHTHHPCCHPHHRPHHHPHHHPRHHPCHHSCSHSPCLSHHLSHHLSCHPPRPLLQAMGLSIWIAVGGTSTCVRGVSLYHHNHRVVCACVESMEKEPHPEKGRKSHQPSGAALPGCESLRFEDSVLKYPRFPASFVPRQAPDEGRMSVHMPTRGGAAPGRCGREIV